MMHTDKELYKINGQKYYTEDYIVANNIPKCKRLNGYVAGWERAWSVMNKNGYINIHTANGVIKGYTYGEHTWFDTEKERDAYRAERSAERAEITYRNKLLARIQEHCNALSTAELEKIVVSL